MRFIWISALKDLRNLRRDPLSVVTWVAIPLCIGLLIHLVFGGSGDALPQGILLVADQDNTIASSLLTNAFSSAGLAKMLTVEKVDEATGRARIDRAESSAFLIIPKGLQDAVINNRPFRLRLFTNPTQRIIPRIVEETLSGMVEAGFYLQRVAGPQLRQFDLKADPTDPDLARMSVESHRLSRQVSHYLSPPLIQLETKIEKEKRTASTSDAFFPNMIFMALLLMANGLSTDIWKEYTQGTLRRLVISPASLAAFLAGRLVMVALLYIAVAIAAVTAARFLAGVTVTNMAAAVAWAAASGTLFYLLLLPVAVFSSGQRGADVRGNMLVFPLAMVGGCFFPFEVMPAWLARIGRWTPNGLAVTQFRDVLMGTVDPRHLAAVMAALAVAGLLAFYLALRRIRGGFLQ